MGKIVISKWAAVAYVTVTLLVILAVGLLVGLVGRPKAPSCEEVTTSTQTTSTSTSTTTTATTTETTTSEPGTTTPTPEPTGPWDNIRLPPYLVPRHYVVDLVPDLEPDSNGQNWFTGTSQVVMEVVQTTSYIYIHSNQLNYSMLEVKDASGNALPQAEQGWWFHSEYQYLIIPMQSDLEVGTNVSLHTEFRGEMSDDLRGLYRSRYTDSAGNSVLIAITQMQPTDARKVFPCFDEPAMKATFDISLSHKDPNFALSNMPNVSTVVGEDGWKKTHFETTPVMSTYLLAFIVCDFDFVENADKSTTQTQIYARPQQIAEGNADYASDVTPRVLEYYSDYFNVSYPLPKSDQIAVPDFALGGMENWGLVMYRETALLYNKDINSESNKQRVAVVVAHELAHQWFGNLISPVWWDELWLNEGFASYIEYLGTDFVEPDWRMSDQFVTNDLQAAMAVDGLTTSRPIVQDVATPAEINALFDSITYDKGACIVRMINAFIGEEAFKLGLTNYLKAYAYGPVNHTQLFEYWAQANDDVGIHPPPSSGATLSQVMDTWVLQMGYPTIKLERQTDRTNMILISQERFLLDFTADKTQPPSPFNYEWIVPLFLKVQGSPNTFFIWFDPYYASQEFSVEPEYYFLGNYEALGYYRVNYDLENWQRLTNVLLTNYEEIDVKSRGQLINDAFNLARTEELDYDIPLGLTESLRNDYDYIPWQSALVEMAYFDLVLGRSKVYGPYSEYLVYLVENVYNNLTWVDEGSHLEKYQRVNAISTACTYGVPGCVEEAIKQFTNWTETGVNSITPNLRTTVYCQTLANTESETWDFVWERYLNESDSQEKGKLQYALTCTRTPWIIRRFLDYVLNDSYVRSQDASGILEDLCYNEYARDITWDFVRQEWDHIYDLYGTSFFSFSGLIGSCTSHFSTEFELQELEQFTHENQDKLGSGLRAAEQAIESTKTNIQWRDMNEDEVFNWLTAKLAEIKMSS